MEEIKEDVHPKNKEGFMSYRDRIIKNMNAYNLSWTDVKNLCYEYYGINISDAWIKYYNQKNKSAKPQEDKPREPQVIEDKSEIITEPSKKLRILCISDIHVPFNLDPTIFDKYAGKTDLLVINGDLLDCYTLSKFTKMYRGSLSDELRKARSYVIEVAIRIRPKKVIAIPGNHEMRLGRAIANAAGIGCELIELQPLDAMAYLFSTGFDVYDHLHDEKRHYDALDIELGRHKIAVQYSSNFWTVIGKTIFVHPITFRQNPLSTTVKAFEYFKTMRLDFDTIVMAHTHHVGFTQYGDYYLYEQGCCADLDKMHYADSKLPKTPQNNGFIYIVQNEDGSLDYDSTKIETTIF